MEEDIFFLFFVGKRQPEKVKKKKKRKTETENPLKRCPKNGKEMNKKQMRND